MRLTRTSFALGLVCSFNGAVLALAPRDSGIDRTGAQPPIVTAPVAHRPTPSVRDGGPSHFESANYRTTEPFSNGVHRSNGNDAGLPICDSCFGSSACDSLFNYQSISKSQPNQWHLLPQSPNGWNVGGFSSIGYHTDGIGSSLYFFPNRVHLEQQWFYAEKVADGRHGLGLGGRVDYVYGSNSQFFQAAGIGSNHWDNSFDNGFPYGHAFPQAYGEAAYGDFSVKVGYFLKITGFESVQASKNFFNSRTLSFVNMPINHTGALTEYRVNEHTTVLNGYIMGLSTAFEDGGDAYIGGISHNLNDRTNITYTTILGRLFQDFGGFGVEENGQVHSVILSNTLTERLTFVNETNLLRVNVSTGGTGEIVSNTSYFFYDLSERIALGSRSEYFHITDVFGESSDIFTQTLGVNVKPTSNLSIRPEVRWVFDRAPLGINNGGDTSNTVFGIDAIFVF